MPFVDTPAEGEEGKWGLPKCTEQKTAVGTTQEEDLSRRK